MRGERRSLIAPAVVADIGEQSANFVADISGYSNVDVCQLVIFYNDDFGIFDEEDDSARRRKHIQFLSHY
jgi:hypothetical protein